MDGLDAAPENAPVALNVSRACGKSDVLPSMDLGTDDVESTEGVSGGLWMPDQDTQGKIYKSIAESAIADGTATPLDEAPCSQADLDNAPSWDVTPRFEMGIGKKLFLVGGSLFERSTALTYPPKDNWVNCGPAPLFAPPPGKDGYTPETLTAGASAAPGIWMPDGETQGKIYKSIADSSFESGKARQIKHAPTSHSELASAPHWDCTPSREMGVKDDLYIVHNRIYVSKTTLTPDVQPSWFSIGPAPMFAPPNGGIP